MFNPCRKIAPPPKKPIPETTCAASLAGSAFTDFPRFRESNINKVEERLIRITVLTPIGCCLNFLSSPRAKPAIKLNRILKPICEYSIRENALVSTIISFKKSISDIISRKMRFMNF